MLRKSGSKSKFDSLVQRFHETKCSESENEEKNEKEKSSDIVSDDNYDPPPPPPPTSPPPPIQKRKSEETERLLKLLKKPISESESDSEDYWNPADDDFSSDNENHHESYDAIKLSSDENTENKENIEKLVEQTRIFESDKDATKAVEDHEIQTNTKFSAFAKDAAYSREDFDLAGHKILFEDIKNNTSLQQIPFTGVPFIILGKKRYDCTNGADRGVAAKKKYKENKLKKMKEDHNFSKSRFHAQNSKKLNCPAVIILRNIVMFPTFKATANTKGCKRTVKEKLKKQWSTERENVKIERVIYGSFPSVSDHSGHLINEFGGMSQQVDKKIISRIKELVRQGTHDTNEMRRNINRYVKETLFEGKPLPPATSRRFFPLQKDIATHILNEENRLKFSKIDQENLEHLVDKWKKEMPNDSFFFRGYIGGKTKSERKERLWFNENGIRIDDNFADYVDDTVEEEGSQLLIVHQTASQRRLLERYGNSLCLLDATYKTTKYAVPLFFVAVKTNVDYQVVASFATQDEKTETIIEALSIIKGWNKNWNPVVFMMDNCDAEINAVESLFPDCFVLLCDFHREQAWLRWLRKSANGMVGVQKEVLRMLRKIAKSKTPKEYNDHVEELKSSDEWKNDSAQHFRDWLDNTWLPLHEKWVAAYRNDLLEVSVNTNNGVETQNKALKYQHLKHYRDKSLSGMMTVLVEQFLPAKYRSYVEKNIRSSHFYRSYNSSLPAWLHNKPKQYVQHCIKKIEASTNLKQDGITRNGDKTFTVQNEYGDSSYDVDFGKDESLPSCTCYSWSSTFLPCKHMFSIMNHVDSVNWETFGTFYRDSVFFKLDFEVFGMKEKETQNNKEESGENETLVDDYDDEDKAENNDEAKSENNDEDKADCKKYAQLPKRTSWKIRGKAEACREYLQEIKNFSYLVNDHHVLDETASQLSQIVEQLKAAAPNDCGLFLEKKEAQLKKKTKTSYGKLQVRKRKQTGRVGILAEMRAESKKIKVDEENNNIKIEEEIIVIDDDAIYDHEMDNRSSSLLEKNMLIKDEDPVQTYNFTSIPIQHVKSKHLNTKEFFKPRISKNKQKKASSITDPLVVSDIERSLIKHGPHQLTYKSIMTLEERLSSRNKKLPIVEGWLQDEIIGAYLYNLCHDREDFRYCEAAVALTLSKEKSIFKLWDGEDLSKTKLVFCPCNPQNNHWILVVLCIEKGEILMLDPMHSDWDMGNKNHKFCFEIAAKLLAQKFRKRNPIATSKKHTLQEDSKNCGVFACFYAKQLIEGKSLEVSFSTQNFRKDIYKCLVGFCFLNKKKNFEQNYETCLICILKKTETDKRSDWVQCERCPQWYHCQCVSLTIGEANLKQFYCPGQLLCR